MGGHTFLKLTGITGGGATDTKHKGFFEITNFSSSVVNVEDDLKDANEQSSGPDIDSISFQKLADKTSPKFAIAACNGKPVGEATIYFCRPSGKMSASTGLENFMEIKLKDVVIESYDLSGGDGYPADTIKIGFSHITWCYKDGNVTEEWDLSPNK